MTFTEIFEWYCDRAAAVQEALRAVRAEADIEYGRLVEHDKRRDAVGMPVCQVVSMQNMSFKTAANGSHFLYKFRQHSISEQIDSLVKRTNRHYQWLLVEAYENFEDFLEFSYAAAAVVDRNHWPDSDYGSIGADDLKSVTFEGLLDQARMKGKKPQSFLNQLRIRLPLMQRFEAENAINVNLWFCVNLIEKLRHHIVHTRGIVASSKNFKRQILEKCGLNNNGRPDKKYLEWIEMYVHKDDSAHVIHLLEVSLPAEGPINWYMNKFDELSNSLLAYAHLIASSFVALESAKPDRWGNKSQIPYMDAPSMPGFFIQRC